jgi:hypothetical protein
MNCQEMEIVIIDLARGSALEVNARDGALAHLEQCPRCAESLAGQKTLSEELMAWNAAMANERAPAALEEKLRAAFRRKPAPAPRRGWLKIAAVGSIAAAVVLFKLLSPAPRVAPPPTPQPHAEATVARGPEQVAAVDSSARTVKKNRPASRLPRPASARREVGTEFLLVPQGDTWTPFDGGRLVRVRLPRSAMSVFGLPVDQERGSERVKADVMLSDDGALRAIRFVR